MGNDTIYNMNVAETCLVIIYRTVTCRADGKEHAHAYSEGI